MPNTGVCVSNTDSGVSNTDLVVQFLLETVVPRDPAKRRAFFERRVGRLTTRSYIYIYIYIYIHLYT